MFKAKRLFKMVKVHLVILSNKKNFRINLIYKVKIYNKNIEINKKNINNLKVTNRLTHS